MADTKPDLEGNIGDTAGKVWQTLSESGEMSVRKLKKSVAVEDRVFYMALGWLTREGKLAFLPTRSGLRVDLS